MALMAELKWKASQSPWQWAPMALALLCGMAAYSNSFRGPFIFDDIDAIETIRKSTGFAQSRPKSAHNAFRPPDSQADIPGGLRLSALRVGRYHATNFLIHLAAGAILFGIVRRNLARREYWADRFERSGPWLAGAVAAIWLVHPLNTEAVTYIVQRAESARRAVLPPGDLFPDPRLEMGGLGGLRAWNGHQGDDGNRADRGAAL